MKALFDTVSAQCSRMVTKTYSTSFSMAVRMLAPSIRQDIYNIYGFVRFADEIVDSFHEYDKETLLDQFQIELDRALRTGISLNPVLNSFQHTVKKYNIDYDLIKAFMQSMRADLHIADYTTTEALKEYIYGSADVVGLMCLKVFVKGDQAKYEDLKDAAMALGSAFQKVNFLRDLKADYEQLNRSYFPDTNFNHLDEDAKQKIINEIEADFAQSYEGIIKLPSEARFGVYTAYVYYLKLLAKLKRTPPLKLKTSRVRVANYQKFGLLASSYVNYRLNLL